MKMRLFLLPKDNSTVLTRQGLFGRCVNIERPQPDDNHGPTKRTQLRETSDQRVPQVFEKSDENTHEVDAAGRAVSRLLR